MTATLDELETELKSTRRIAERAAEAVAGISGGGKANAALLQDRRMSKAAPAAGNFLGWNATTKKWEPMAPTILEARCTSTLTLNTIATSMTGDGDSSKVRVLLPAIGEWLILGTFDFDVSTLSSGNAAIGELFLDDSGTAETGAAIKSMEAVDRATVSQVWEVTTTSANTPVELKTRKDSAGGGVTARTTHTTIVAIGLVGGASPVTVSAHDILSTSHGDVATAAVTRGSLIVGNATPDWAELVVGTAGQVIRSDGSDALWATLSHADLGGLLVDDHTQYLLLAGRSGGQTAIGGTAAGEDLILRGTSHATPGDVIIDNTSALVVGNSGIDDRLGTLRMLFSNVFAASALTIRGATGGVTVLIEDGRLDVENGGIRLTTRLDLTAENLAGAFSGFRVQPTVTNEGCSIQAVPNGTATQSTFDMFNDSGAADANRIRFGASAAGLGLEVASGLAIGFTVLPGSLQFHLDATDGYVSLPMRFGDTAAATEDIEVVNDFGWESGTGFLARQRHNNLAAHDYDWPRLSGNVIVIAGAAAQGEIAYHDGTDWTRLAVGTARQALISRGATANPKWADLGAWLGWTGQPAGANDNNTTFYSVVQHPVVTTGSEQATYFRVPHDGVLANYLLDVNANSLVTGTAVCTIRVNGANTAVTISIGPGATGIFTDYSNSVAISQGDVVTMAVVIPGEAGNKSVSFRNMSLGYYADNA